MKSCTSIFGDPQKWPWDPVRPATCTPVSNGWIEVEKKHPGINSSNEIFRGMMLKQLGLHCHTITTTAPEEKHININIHVNDKSWNLELSDKSFSLKFHGRASRLCKWVSANFLTKHPVESTISGKSGNVETLYVWHAWFWCRKAVNVCWIEREWISLSFRVMDELKSWEFSLEITRYI